MNLKKILLLCLIFTFVSSAAFAAVPNQRTINNPDGTKYVGQTRNMMPHGQGTLYNRDGSVRHSGMFKNGQLVSAEPQKYSFGMKFGLGYSFHSDLEVKSKSESWSDIYEAGLGFVPNIGGAFTYFLNTNINIIAEVMYEFRWLQYDWYDGGDNSIKSNAILSYITIPVGVHYSIIENFFVGGGFYYSVNIHSVGRMMEYRFDAKNDFGLFIDIGMKPKEVQEISLYARYQYGMTDFIEFQRSRGNYNITKNQRTRILSLNVAYHF